jgi:hypothetical protein
VADRSQCRECGAALPGGANFCVECGASVAPLVVDLLGVDEPLLSGSDVTAYSRRGLWAVLGLFAGMVLVLRGLTRGVDRPNDEPLGAETPEEGIGAVDPATSTTAVTTTASPTTGTPTTGTPTAGVQTTTSEQLFVNDAAGPVLGEDVGGVLVRLGGSIMQQVDLSTGAIERINLEHSVYFSDEGQSGIVVNGNAVTWSPLLGTLITVTDLSNGSQRQPRDITDENEPFFRHVAGRAGEDSVWLATDSDFGWIREAIEVDVEGEVRRRVEIPRQFEIRGAEGDDLILDSPDGSWRYDTDTGVAVRMPGPVLAFAPGFVITSSCDESLQCELLLDQGNGPEVVDWLSASDEFDDPIDVSPDGSGALLHTDTQGNREFTYIDLHTGSRVDLGNLPIDPDRGVVWVEGSRWIIGQNDGSNRTFAINTETGTQVDLALPRLSIHSCSWRSFHPRRGLPLLIPRLRPRS